eukprot:m.105281 g.105281  ORF g.105281 m.105281 type:complete len:559 (-) comp10548_c0_seq1:1400-3076(-)
MAGEDGALPRRIMTGPGDDDPHISLSAVVQAVIAAQRLGRGPDMDSVMVHQALSQTDGDRDVRRPLTGEAGPCTPTRMPSSHGYTRIDERSPYPEASLGSEAPVFPKSPLAVSGGPGVSDTMFDFDFPPRTVSKGGASNVRISDVQGLPFGCVIHFTNAYAELDCLRPWKVNSPGIATGTGFYIGNKRIITNNHVVDSGTSIRVRRHGIPGNFEASVLCTSGVCDLALVTVLDDEFWDGIPAAEFQDEVPALDDTVVAVGYPMHASTVTLTRGVVSNVHLKDLSLGNMNEAQLCVQIDAAINPGNSGGPVFNQETHKVVGVAFAGLTEAEGMGFIIPTPVVKNFISVYETTGDFAGLPSLGVHTQDLVNDSLRKYAFGSPTKHSNGVLIQKIQPFSCAKEAGVQEGDILMAIDGNIVSQEGEVSFRGHERVGYEYLISKRPLGDTVALTILRKQDDSGKIEEMTINVGLAINFALVPRELGKAGFEAHYVIAGGLVLLAASVPLVKACMVEARHRIFDAIVKVHRKEYECDYRSTEGVLVCDCLAHEINVSYGDYIGK